MLPESREERLGCYRNALRNHNFEGYVVPNPHVTEWLANEFPELTWREIRRELHRYVEDGGMIDEQKEYRPEYVSCEFHYDLRVKIRFRAIYFETVLKCKNSDDPDDPTILVVNCHDV